MPRNRDTFKLGIAVMAMAFLLVACLLYIGGGGLFVSEQGVLIVRFRPGGSMPEISEGSVVTYFGQKVGVVAKATIVKEKDDEDSACINMARRGFVVLSYDPIGQGERGVSFRDHRRTAALLLGVSQQGLVVFESRCALDLLLSRDDVDPDRIGITGASGGGYNTWIMTAIDSRIAAAVPVVGTSEFYEQLHVCRPLDWYRAKEHCHFVPGLFGYANNHELLALAWPRPVLVISAAGDQSFPLPGIRQVVAYGRELYAPEGESRFDAFEDHAAGHGYQKAKREAAYGWFERWLGGKGDASPIPEPATKTVPFDAPELRCFPDGKRAAGPGIVTTLEALLADLPSATLKPDRADLRRSLALALGLASVGAATSIEPSIELGGHIIAGGTLAGRELVWTTRDGLRIPSVLVTPAGAWKGVVLAVSDAGKRAALESDAVAEAVGAGLAVVAADIRGIGELAVGERGWVFAVSLLLGENFVGRQALDLVDGVGALATLDGVGEKPIGLLALGPAPSATAR